MSQSVGVGTGALLLYLLLAVHGTAGRAPADFSFALADGRRCISMLSVPFFLRMSPDAGAEVSGRPVASIAPSKMPGSNRE